MKIQNKSILLTVLLWLIAIVVHAQSYSIGWEVVAGGGGLTSGGGYSVNSTVGENVAGGSLSGGSYQVASGFWSIYSVSVPGGTNLNLSIFLSDTNTVVISWPVTSIAWTLQQSAGLVSGTWLSVSNTVSAVTGQNQVILPASSGNQFYRLHSH